MSAETEPIDDHELSVLPSLTKPTTFQASCVCGYTSTVFSSRGPATRAGKAHMKSVVPRALPFWQSAPCPSWCVVEHSDVKTERRHCPHGSPWNVPG